MGIAVGLLEFSKKYSKRFNGIILLLLLLLLTVLFVDFFLIRKLKEKNDFKARVSLSEISPSDFSAYFNEDVFDEQGSIGLNELLNRMEDHHLGMIVIELLDNGFVGFIENKLLPTNFTKNVEIRYLGTEGSFFGYVELGDIVSLKEWRVSTDGVLYVSFLEVFSRDLKDNIFYDFR